MEKKGNKKLRVILGAVFIVSAVAIIVSLSINSFLLGVIGLAIYVGSCFAFIVWCTNPEAAGHKTQQVRQTSNMFFRQIMEANGWKVEENHRIQLGDVPTALFVPWLLTNSIGKTVALCVDSEGHLDEEISKAARLNEVLARGGVSALATVMTQSAPTSEQKMTANTSRVFLVETDDAAILHQHLAEQLQRKSATTTEPTALSF